MSHLLRTMMGAAGVSSPPVTVTWVAKGRYYSSQSSSITYSSKNLGTASPDRVIVVGYGCPSSSQNGLNVSAVTVGGTSLTHHAVHAQGTDASISGLWSGLVPSGTSGNIVLTLSGGSVTRIGIGVWAMTGSSVTSHDSMTSTVSPGTGTIDCPEGGAIIGIKTVSKTGDQTFTWAGIDWDFAHKHQTALHDTGGSKAFETAQSGLTVSCTSTIGGNHTSTAVASFGKA